MHIRPQFYIHISTPLCRFWKIDLQKSQIKSSASELVQLVKCQQNLATRVITINSRSAD